VLSGIAGVTEQVVPLQFARALVYQVLIRLPEGPSTLQKEWDSDMQAYPGASARIALKGIMALN
jgi:hypothetical protein